MPTAEEVKRRIPLGEWWLLTRLKELYSEAEDHADWYKPSRIPSGSEKLLDANSDCKRLFGRGLLDAKMQRNKDGTISRTHCVYRINLRGLAHERNDSP